MSKKKNDSELLKNAIADAKAVRDTALANAKAALEEAFTPKLQSMLSAKIQNEADDAEEEEKAEEEEFESVDNGEETVAEDQEIEEGDGYTESPAKDSNLYEEDEADEEDDSDIEEGDGHTEKAAKGAHLYEEEEDDEMADDEEIAEEDIDLEAVIKELEGSEDISEDGDMDMDYDEDEVEGEEEIDLESLVASLKGEADDVDMDYEDDEEMEAEAEMEDEDDEYKERYESLKDAFEDVNGKLKEVNLLNAKLLYTNKIFKAGHLTESDKIKVIENFDRASSVREVKLVYATLAESIKFKKGTKSITEGASKAGGSTKPSKEIIKEGIEEDTLAARMKKLANITVFKK